MFKIFTQVLTEWIGYVSNYVNNQDKSHDPILETVNDYNEGYLNAWQNWKKRENFKREVFFTVLVVCVLIYGIYKWFKK